MDNLHCTDVHYERGPTQLRFAGYPTSTMAASRTRDLRGVGGVRVLVVSGPCVEDDCVITGLIFPVLLVREIAYVRHLNPKWNGYCLYFGCDEKIIICSARAYEIIAL